MKPVLEVNATVLSNMATFNLLLLPDDRVSGTEQYTILRVRNAFAVCGTA
jgi:hypothetical protein